jgi:hypothetical protein
MSFEGEDRVEFDIVSSAEASILAETEELLRRDTLDGTPIRTGPFGVGHTIKGLSDDRLIAKENSPSWDVAAAQSGHVVLQSPGLREDRTSGFQGQTPAARDVVHAYAYYKITGGAEGISAGL